MLLDGIGQRVDPEQVQPAVAHELAHDLVAGHHRVDRRAGCLDEDAQAQRRVAQRMAVVQRLHRQPDAQVAAIAIEHTHQPVSLVGKPRRQGKAFRFPDELADVPLLLPGRDNDIRAGFDLLCERLGIRYRLRAKVDDMALLRLLARDSDSVALLPTVVGAGRAAQRPPGRVRRRARPA